MKRLIKENNHVGPIVREDVEKDILNGERTLKRNSSDSYLIARQLIMDSTISPTNENMLIITNNIDSGKYSDLGNSSDNWDKWLERTQEIFKNNKILLANRLIKKSDAVRLNNTFIDAQSAINSIQIQDARLTPDRLSKDTSCNKCAVWGAIDDTGNYVVEIYSYNVNGKKINVSVVAKIIDGVVDNSVYEIKTTERESISDLKQRIITDGVTFAADPKLKFTKEYNDLSQIQI